MAEISTITLRQGAYADFDAAKMVSGEMAAATDTEQVFVSFSDGTAQEMALKKSVPYIGENGNWWIGDTDTGFAAAGSGGSCVSITQLWENADPTKEFQGEQQFDFDDNYDLFIVTYKRKTAESDPYCFTYIIKPGSGVFAFGFDSAKISYRGCSETGANYIYFNNANILGSYGTSPTGKDNTRMIPWYIYGVKFA